MVNRTNLMVLTVDDRRKMAAMFALFIQVDGRNKKVAKNTKKKSKPQDKQKARSPTGLRGSFFSVPMENEQIEITPYLSMFFLFIVVTCIIFVLQLTIL